MPNLTESATFDANVYRIDQNDPVQGWDGSAIGISNQQAQALANRTQFLKAKLDLGPRFTGFLPFTPGSSGDVLALTPPNLKGVLIRVDTSSFDGVLTMPPAASCEENSNMAVSVEPGSGLKFIASNGKFCVLGPSGADTFLDADSGRVVTNYTIHPYSIVRVHRLSNSEWMVWKESAVEICPPGMIAAWGVNAQPYGWLECNGSAISKTLYARLFDQIGTTFGVGNGTTTFNIPDMRGEFIRGWDNGRGVDANSVAKTGSITNGSTSVTGLGTTAELAVGMTVTGTGIAGGTTIAAIVSGTAITLSANATATNASAALTFAGRMFGSFQNDAFKAHHHSFYRIPHFGIASGTAAGGIVADQINSTTGFDTARDPSPTPTLGGINDNGGAETRPRSIAMMYCIKY